MAKIGRKAKHYRDPDTGVEIHGLGRRPCHPGKPGRFYAIDEQNKTFGSDKKAAIIKYEAYGRERSGGRAVLLRSVDDVVSCVASGDIRLPGTNGDGTLAMTSRHIWDQQVRFGTECESAPDHFKGLAIGTQAFEERWAEYREERGLGPEARVKEHGTDYVHWLIARWIKTDPIGAAQELRIPQLKNLDGIKPPKPGMKLCELGPLYLRKFAEPTVGHRRMIRHYERFAKIVGVKTIKQIEHEHVEQYFEHVTAERERDGWGTNWAGERFNAVKTVFMSALKRGRDKEAVNAVLLHLTMLEAPEDKTELKSNPVSRETLHKMLECADVQFKAILLTALNCAFYSIDIFRLPLAAVDLDKGVLVFPRSKPRGRPITRYAVLWLRTGKAIRDYQRAHPHNAVDKKTGKPLLFGTLEKGMQLSERRFYGKLRNLKQQAGTPDFEFAHLRDAVATRPVEAGIDDSITQTDILLGHKLRGDRDAYLLRGPVIVAPACAAIEKYYFG